MVIRAQAGIKVWLVALVALAMLPLFLFSAYSIYQTGQALKGDDLRELEQRAETAANAVNQRLATSLGYLSSLATSDAAQSDDLQALYAHAHRIVDMDPEVSSFSLIGPDNSMLFLTLRPFGSAAVAATDPESAKRVFNTGKPAASGPFKSPVSDKMVTAIGVPVFQNGKVAYCLRLTLRTNTLNDVLAAQTLPPEWASAIMDRQGTLLARSRAPEEYVGKPATPGTLLALRNHQQGVFDVLGRNDVPFKTVLKPVPAWDWTVVVGVPKAVLDAAPNRALIQLVAVGLTFAVLGLALTLSLADYITRHIAAVASVAAALHRGEQVEEEVFHTPIRELGDMVQQLGDVTKREQRTNLALLNISALHGVAAPGPNMARRDRLTGLANRSLFMEMVDGLGKYVVSSGGNSRLAFLVIALDGLQALADTRGREQADKVLAQLGGVLGKLTRDSDATGRLDGDQFIVCLTAPTEQMQAIAQSVATRLVARIMQIGWGVSCSIGVAVWTDDCPDAAHAMRQAETAMRQAQSMGTGQYAVFGGER